MKESWTSLTFLLRVAFGAFLLAAFGAALGFLGWYAVDSRLLSELGFALVVVGVLAEFVVVIVGQIVHGRRAVTGSFQAMKNLRERLRNLG